MAQSDGNAGPGVSRELLSVGGGGGIGETLLLSSKPAKKKATTLQTARLPRSNLLDKVQNFLPQMASANNQLRREMDSRPGQEFDIEHVDPSMEKIIEMNVALVELNDSDTMESEDDSEYEDSSICEEVTEENIKLPLSKKEGHIEILDSKT
ncbi:NOP protein chaperone 1 [Candoia aspera]|uniref:NOP protein chaperone 1 n=1 Tax=Candoia aspera TaxID=51853 RepID=UPI002FD83966